MAIERARAYLKQFGVDGRILEFEVSSATVELAAQAAGVIPARIAKSLSFMTPEGPILVVTAGDMKIDNPKYKSQFHTKAKMLGHDEVEALNVRVFRTPDPATGNPRAPYVAPATLQEDGIFRCYLTPLCFSDVASDLQYDLIGLDAEGNARHLGVGTLRVLTSHLTEDGALPDVIPQDTYIYNPTTGLWHKLVATVDESGVITTAVEQEGVER